MTIESIMIWAFKGSAITATIESIDIDLINPTISYFHTTRLYIISIGPIHAPLINPAIVLNILLLDYIVIQQ